jgi:ubiquinone/menaquinone biosynthesis C-methylase UbiE
MLMYGWMVFVEHAPERYDWAAKVMTFGRLDQIKDLIAAQVNPGDKVLDIGCGTGTLALRCIERGAHVTGLDSSEFMLGEAVQRVTAAGHEQSFVAVRDSVTQLHKHFGDETFDMVTATMCLGEFPGAYLGYVLRDCARILRPGGALLVGDECWPRSRAARTLYRLAMTLFWIPQFLLLRRPLFPIRDLDGTITRAGFTVTDGRSFKGTSFRLVRALRPADPRNGAPDHGDGAAADRTAALS